MLWANQKVENPGEQRASKLSAKFCMTEEEVKLSQLHLQIKRGRYLWAPYFLQNVRLTGNTAKPYSVFFII